MTALDAQSMWHWQQAAACQEEEASLFFGPEDESPQTMQAREHAAAQVCAICPVVASCLDHALSQPEVIGVWGGTGEKDRKRLLRQRRRQGQNPKERKHQKTRPGRRRAVGDARILQGLAVDGYGLKTVRAWSRISTSTLNAVRSGNRWDWPESCSGKLRSALPHILKEPPPRFGAVSTWALSQGWVSLGAWDLSRLDDPDATPTRSRVA